MHVKIFQINSERDEYHVRFFGLEHAKQIQGFAWIDSSLYDEVFEGDADCINLEGVYKKFNTGLPPLHRGQS